MKRLLLFLGILATANGCAQLPKIYPDSTAIASQALSDCMTLFPQGRWQLYHVIEATVPGGQKKALTGVSVISSQDRSIQWALMTVEGFVLFSGRYDGALTVDRAVAPFDRPGFAQGLMDDLTLLFLSPRAPHEVSGRLENGGRVCRFGTPDETTDIVISGDGIWYLHQYNSSRRLMRTIVADETAAVGNDAFAKHLILKNHSVIGYQLELRLLEAIPLE